MKKILFIFILLLLLPPVIAPYPQHTIKYLDDIQIQAELLQVSNKQQTVERIDRWVEHSIQHKVYWWPQDIDYVWQYRIGDCTDKARMKVIMLENIGIETRLVHGWAIYENKRIMHDWYEYKLKPNQQWRSIEQNNFPDATIKKTGYGVW